MNDNWPDAAYTDFGHAVWFYMNTHKRTFEPWLTKLFDKAFISRPQPAERPDAVDWKALAREAQRSRDEAWNTAAALRSLFTTYEAPPLPNGKVLIQHQVTGAPVRLHEKGHPCVICDALDAAPALPDVGHTPEQRAMLGHIKRLQERIVELLEAAAPPPELIPMGPPKVDLSAEDLVRAAIAARSASEEERP